MEQEGMKVAQVLVDTTGSITGRQAVIHVVKDLLALDVSQVSDGIVREKLSPQAGVSSVETHTLLVPTARPASRATQRSNVRH
jgi:hypothetical protein